MFILYGFMVCCKTIFCNDNCHTDVCECSIIYSKFYVKTNRWILYFISSKFITILKILLHHQALLNNYFAGYF